MRRILTLLWAVSVLLFCGCVDQQKEPDLQQPFRFYYRINDGQDATGEASMNNRLKEPMDYELREITGHETDYRWVLEQYFLGPESEDLVAPFQKSTKLISVKLIDAQLRLMVSDDISELSGIDLTLACACITRTCMGFDGVESVSISAEGATLAGKTSIVMHADNMLLEDSGADINSVTYLLYFSDTDNRYLIGEEIQVSRELDRLPEYLVCCLISGPSETGLAETMPLGTTLLSLEVSDGVCIVDLSGEFLEFAPRTDLTQRMTLLSLTNTLTQLEEIRSVALYVNGEPLSQYGMMDLSQPLTFEAGAVGPARTSLNELDVDLYLYIGQSQLLSKLPTRVRYAANEVPVEQVLLALLAHQDQNGYSSAIPEGTEVLSVQIDGNVCSVDLSKEILAAEEVQVSRAVRCICATALAAGDCGIVQLTVEGQMPEGDYAHLFGYRTWDESWLAPDSSVAENS